MTSINTNHFEIKKQAKPGFPPAGGMRNKPATKAACLLALGILLGKHMNIGTCGLFWSVLACAGLAFLIGLVFPRCRIVPGLILAGFILAGAFRFAQENRLLPSDHIIRFMDPSMGANRAQRVLIKGTLSKDPAQKSNRIEILLDADSLGTGSAFHAAEGLVLIPLYARTACPLRFGDIVLASGTLTAPAGVRNPGGFDYREWLALQGIHVVLKCGPMDGIRLLRRGGGNAFFRICVYPVRRFALAVMDSTVRDDNARAVLRALTLGDQGLISSETREDFSKTGVVHILSVSGSHVGFMFLILSMVFGFLRFPAVLNTAAIAAGLCFYSALTESSAPVVRATVMALVLLIGARLERKADPVNTLGVAGLLILSWKPQELFDVGFQLSFLSVLSIVTIYERLKNLLSIPVAMKKTSGSEILRSLSTAALVSLAAQIGTAPVTAYYFNWIPLVSIPANMIAIPLSGLIMAVSFTSLILAPVHFWTASAYAALNGRLLAIFVGSMDWMEKIPFSSLSVPSPDSAGIILLYAILLLIFNLRHMKIRRITAVVILLSANVAVWPRIFENRSGTMRWIQFDVGQGDAALFRMPRGGTLLVDAGPRLDAFDCGEKTIAPYLRRNGIRKLDAMVITHPHNDHAGGAEYLILHFRIGEIIVPAVSDTSRDYRRLLETARAKRVRVRSVTELDSLSVFMGVKVMVCNPLGGDSDSENVGPNERSLVVLAAYGKTRWISMGDAGVSSEVRLAKSLQWDRCDVVKIGHHGSRSSSSLEFLQKVRPAHAVISVGENNRFGHPSGEVLERISLVGSRIHRTDREQAVIFESDGNQTGKIRWH
jgi:competence protein ComEC